MKYYLKSFYQILIDEINESKDDLFIISPYVTTEAVAQLIYSDDVVKSIVLITLPPGIEYLTGASDPEALLMLANRGITVRMLDGLHAKIYMFDNRTMYLGSANFTSRGLSINGVGNMEIMIRRDLSYHEAEEIKQHFLKESYEVEITEAWLAETKKLLNQHKSLLKKMNSIQFPEPERSAQNRYVEFLNKRKLAGEIQTYEHVKNGMNRNVYLIDGKATKLTYSQKGTHLVNGTEHTFSYQILPSAAKFLRSRKLKALVCLQEEGTDNFVCLPTGFLLDHVLLPKYTNQNGDWQFKLRRTSGGMKLKPHGRKVEIDVTGYMSKFHYVKQH